MQTEARLGRDSEGISASEKARLSEFIVTRATKSRAGYESSWRTWAAYRDGLHESVRPSLFLGELSHRARAVRLSCYVKALHDHLVKRTRRAARPTPEEAAELDDCRRRNRSLPSSLDIIWPIREEIWCNESWLCPGMDRRAVWLAIALGFYSGCRLSNLAKGDKNRPDHVIRARDVVSAVRRGNSETSRAAGVSHEDLCHGRWSVRSTVPVEAHTVL